MEAAEAKSRSDRGVPPPPADAGLGGEVGGVRPELPQPLASVGAGTWPQGREDFPPPPAPGKPGPGPSAAFPPMTTQDDKAGRTRVPSSAVREQTLDLGPRTPSAWDP